MELTPTYGGGPLARIKRLITDSKVSQAEFARRIGIDPSNLSKALTGRTTVSEALINRVCLALNVNRTWLRDGDGPIYTRQEAMVPDGAPVYDIDFTAGPREFVDLFRSENITGYMNIPEVNPDSVVVHVSGDSMMPTITDGAYLALREVKPGSIILWGEIYGVVLDDYRMVKTLRKHPDPNMVVLHSENPNYDDIDILKSDIRHLFFVETVINVSRRY